MSLPTYEQAVTKPLLVEIVQPYLTPHDLAVASRVCKSWEKLCTPILWRDPVKILAKQDLPYSRTFQFLDMAVNAPEDHRKLLHTLDFRPLVALQSKYPRDYELHVQYMNGIYMLHVCYQLHHTKVIILDGIVDWSSLSSYGYVTRGYDPDGLNAIGALASSAPSVPSTARYSSATSARSSQLTDPRTELSSATPRHSNRKGPRLSAAPKDNDNSQQSSLRPFSPVLLSLNGCSGVDGIRAICFPCFITRDLTFLDLSFTDCGTVYSQAFSNLPFPSLRILKLRGLRLTDRYIPKFDLRSGGNVWSLDLRDNMLTDKAIDVLYGWLLPSLPMQFTDNNVRNYHPPPSYGQDYESSRDATNGIVALRSDTKDDFIEHLKTNPNTNLDIDPLERRTGLTHLYLSGNKLSSAGVRKLLTQTNRLNVLDVGSVRDMTEMQFKVRRATSWDQTKSVSGIKISSNYNIKFLRIHHSLVTCMPTAMAGSASNENANTPTSFSIRHLLAAESIGRARVENNYAAFRPIDNSLMETLELTGVPTKSYGFLIDRLVAFLEACRKQEVELSGARVTTHRRAPEVLPGLKTLRLEFIPPDDLESTAPSHRGSVSGDSDADAFSAASNKDFSFFSDAGELERPLRLDADSRSRTGFWDIPLSEAGPLKDVVEELKKARREAGENKWGGNLEIMLPQSTQPSTEWRGGIFS